MVISCLYVQTVIRQCFCFPNSQWGATAHDTGVGTGQWSHVGCGWTSWWATVTPQAHGSFRGPRWVNMEVMQGYGVSQCKQWGTARMACRGGVGWVMVGWVTPQVGWGGSPAGWGGSCRGGTQLGTGVRS